MAVATEEKAEMEHQHHPVKEPETEGELHAEDVHAAKAVAGLMITIFILGVIIYTTIAFLAAGGAS